MEDINTSAVNEYSCLNWKDKSLDILKRFFTEERLSACPEESSSLLKKKEIIEEKIASISNELIDVQKELNDIESENPRDPNKYRMQLYELITNITWDVDSLPNEVKGYVSKPFNTFSLNKERDSDFFRANYLWKLIGDEKSLSKDNLFQPVVITSSNFSL